MPSRPRSGRGHKVSPVRIFPRGLQPLTDGRLRLYGLPPGVGKPACNFFADWGNGNLTVRAPNIAPSPGSAAGEIFLSRRVKFQPCRRRRGPAISLWPKCGGTSLASPVPRNWIVATGRRGRVPVPLWSATQTARSRDGAAAPAFRISGEPRTSDVIPAIQCCRGVAIPKEDLCLLNSAHI
jgi:hypothetical protein